MDIPVFYKDIKIGDRTFRIKKFNAMTGCYITFKITGLLAGSFKDVFKNIDKDFKIDDLNLTELFSSIFSLPKEDFDFIQKTCLQSVFELLPGGEAQFLNNIGECETSKPVEDMCDTALFMNLTIQTLAFNLKSFFEGSNLTSLLGKINL